MSLVEIEVSFDGRYKISIIMNKTPSLNLEVTKPMSLCPGARSSGEQQANIGSGIFGTPQ